jgi:hypothetical protein
MIADFRLASCVSRRGVIPTAAPSSVIPSAARNLALLLSSAYSAGFFSRRESLKAADLQKTQVGATHC